MELRICKKCNTSKELLLFVKDKGSKNGYRNECKVCYNERMNKYRRGNKEWREKASRYQRKRRKENPEIQLKYRGRYKDRLTKWAKTYNSDPLVKLKNTLRSRLNGAIKRKGFSKNTKTADTIGCSWEELKKHLESQFLEGMSWDNRDEWHIDHIKPLALAKTEEEVYELNHYSNLQPLWVIDNLKKGAKY